MTCYLGITKIPQFASGNKPHPSSEDLIFPAKKSCHFIVCCGSKFLTQFDSINPQNSPPYHKFSDFNPKPRRRPLTNRPELSNNNDLKPASGTVISNLKDRFLPFHLIIKTEDTGILRFRMGEKKFSLFMNSYLDIAKKELSFYNSRRFRCDEDLLLAGFLSAQEAISCLMALYNSMKNITDHIAVKMVLKQREFFESKNAELKADPFFFYKIGEIKPTIDHRVIQVAGNKLRKLSLATEDLNIIENKEHTLLCSLVTAIRENWQNPHFKVADLCRKVSSSTSRLYRSCKTITGLSPVRLIKEYRLLCCLRSFKSKKSITEILYDSGFNSPSYFSRCFRKRFGISPYYYQKHLVKSI